jgi:hypothetical protein
VDWSETAILFAIQQINATVRTSVTRGRHLLQSTVTTGDIRDQAKKMVASYNEALCRTYLASQAGAGTEPWKQLGNGMCNGEQV